MTPSSAIQTAVEPPRTKSWLEFVIRSLISFGLIGGSIALMAFIGTGAPPPPRPVEVQTPFVQAERVAAYDFSEGIKFDVDGVVIPFREIEVATEVEGRIDLKSDNCRTGHTVKKGELLVRIDQEEYNLEIRRIGENVKLARANLQELEVEILARNRQILLAEEDLVIKRREMDRYDKIDDPGVYSKSELDTARLKELQARDALQTENDQLELLEASRNRLNSAIDLGLAQLDKASLDLKRTEIHAPIDGIITQEGPEQGGYLQRGGMVAVVQDISLMEIRCSLPMRQMSWLWQSTGSAGELAQRENAYQLPRTPATVQFDLGSAMCQWQGTLAYFDGGSVDQQTRMVPCRVVVQKPQEVEFLGDAPPAAQSAPITLLAGMFVNVEINASPGIHLLRLPERAVQPGNHVWAVTPDDSAALGHAAQLFTSYPFFRSLLATEDIKPGNLHKHQLNVAHATDDQVLIYPKGSNLKPGDLVVISPLTAPTENARVVVEIVEPQ